MGTLIKLSLLLLAVGLVSSKFAVPLTTYTENDGGVCSSECTDGIISDDVVFVENRKYGYEFNGKTTIIAPTGTSDGKSEISIKGKVNIIGTQKCGAILYLKNVEITQGSKIYGNTKLEGYPIVFSYNNGKIGQNICSFAKDSIDSMNLKRSIVSALQVSSVQVDPYEFFETDVQGTCNTTYSSSSSDSHRTVIKDKDLTQCTGHDKINLFGLSSSESDRVYEDSPFLKALQRSEIQITQSTLKSISSQDIFVYQPFGPIDIVTKIISTVNLNLKKISPVNAPSLILNKGRSIIFEKTKPFIGLANADELVKATQLASSNLEPVVEMGGAKLYADLIALLKVAKKADILSAYQLIKSGVGFDNTNTAESIFIDALTTANSGESIEAVVELMSINELNDSLAVSWFMDLAKAKRPTKEAVASASNLLNQKALKEGFMGVGALLRQYLKDSQDYDSPEVMITLNNLGAPLKHMFDTSLSSDDENLMIASLKGLGNAQYINRDLEDLILQIIINKSASQRIRTAALSMVQTYAKNSEVEKTCERVFTDTSEDSELRILAFKVYAINPSNYKATVIKNVLDDKNCQLQIRTFLLSYLNNLQNTIDVNKLDQKRFYEGIKITSSKKMLSDILRYSQSLEYNHHSPLLNSGVLLNGDVIYSYKSFLARSSSVSLKALIFGRKHNVFDFDVRVENIEFMLEKLFGPEGYFAKSNGYILDDIKNYVTQAITYAKNRGLNDVNSELIPEKDCENTPEDDMKKMYIDIALKAFGNDLGWFAFQGRECQVTYQNLIDAILNNFDNSVPDKNHVELNIRKQIPIIDYEKKYATCSGLPVSLQIQAMSAIKLNIATKFNLEKYFKHPENVNFGLKLIPSGSITLSTLLTIDGYVVEAGNKIKSSLHTSTGSDISLVTIQGRGFEMIYGLPLEVMDVISLKSGAFTTVQEKGQPIVEIPLMTTGIDRQMYTRTFENLNTIGLSYYVQYDYPWNGELQSLLPFSGPSSISFKFLKVDKNLTKYVVKGTYGFKSPTMKYVKFIFVTPKSDVNRGVELFIAFDTHKDAKLVTELITPSSKMIVQSTYANSDVKKTVEIIYINGSEHVFNVGVKCEEVDNETTKYIPIFEAAYSREISTKKNKHPLVPNFDIEGCVLVQRNMNPQIRYSSKLTLKDIALVTPQSRHSLQGSLTFENNGVNGNACLTSGGFTINTDGFIQGDYPVYKMSGSFDVIRNQGDEELLLTDESDDYKQSSKFVALLNKAKKLNLFTSQEFHIKAPFVFLSTNHIILDNDHIEINGDFFIENNELTMRGNISTPNFLDMALNANMTIMPSTPDSGIFVLGHLQQSFISYPSNTGHGYFKYVQDMDKKGSHFEFNSDFPSADGVFHLNTQHRTTDESYTYNLNCDIHNDKILKVAVNIITDNFDLKVNFDSPNPEYKTYIIAHGWSEKENAYLFDTKLLWPGSQNSNYLNANGSVFLNGLDSHMSGNFDCPSTNLKNVHLSVKSINNPEVENGGIVAVHCVSNEQVILSEKFKYKSTINNNELYLSGESIHEDSQNIIPIHFALQYRNYTDKGLNIGKELAYRIALEHNGRKRIYQKCLQATNRVFIYRQLYKIDNDEQKIAFEIEYNVTDAWNWHYNLKSRIISPSVFHYLVYDNQNILELNSHIKLGGYSMDQGHDLKVFTKEGVPDLYEFKWFINREKSAIKFLFGQREIRGLGYYSLKSINEGYHLTYSGEFWLDYNTNPNAESSLSLDTYYSLDNGLSTATDFTVVTPLFNDKEMGVKTDVQMFKSWENPLSVKLELNIFPTTEQTLLLRSNVNRKVQDNGILYFGELLAKSDGMKIEYLVRDSIFASSDKWGKHLDATFIDADNVKRPIQFHVELVSGGFINKINIFDITVINIDSSINIKDEALNTRSVISYNDHPYLFELSLNTYPSFKYTTVWNDKTGSPQKLVVEGSIAIDDSAVISATHIINNGEEVVPMGFVKKSLEKQNWWDTNNRMSTEHCNIIWQSLKGECIERFINVHSDLVRIISVAKKLRKLRYRESRRAKSQYNILIEYTRDERNQILNEVWKDDYLPKIPYLIKNSTEALFVETIDFMEYLKLIDSFRSLGENIKNYSKEVYSHYTEQTDLVLNKITRSYDELLDQAKLTLIDLLNMLNIYTDKFENGMSPETRSLNDHINDIIYKITKTIEELKGTINNVQDISVNYFKNLPIYETFHDQIEKLKSYPYKEKLCEEIHQYLHELEITAPTKDFASFINALDKYINNVINNIPVNQRDITSLRNKGLIVAKSMIFDFSNYVNYDRAMSVYDKLHKLTDFGKTVLYIISPNSFPHPNDSQNTLYGFSECMRLYHKYLNPSNILPPFKAQSVVIASNNIVTYNGQSYSFMPNTGSYILARDFKNNKFSILANYNDNNLTSISLLSNNDELYVLLPGGIITINGKNVDFPSIRDNVKTWKDFYYFGIDVAVGVSIKCNMDLNIVEIFINGYYYGQVFGLLGAMYQEPTFDFKLPNGKPSNNLASFVLAYRNTGNDEPTINDLLPTDQIPCSSLFSGISSLKSVFPIISPTAYRSICNQIVSTATSEENSQNKACLVAKAYVSMARQNFMTNCCIPDMCVKTTVYERTLYATTNVQISDASDVADIMVLFEETQEDVQPFSNTLKLFIEKVTNDFKHIGINDINFIFIGYSGKLVDSEVHIYTANKDSNYDEILDNVPVWSSSQTTNNTNNNIMSSQFVQSLKKVTGKDSKDKAYQLSANYPFRANAVKVVLSIAQTLYTQSSPGVSLYTFNYITSCFVKQGIKFYLVAPINLTDSSDEGIFGISGVNKTFTMSAPLGQYSDVTFAYDKSLETGLVLKTNGAMYNSQSFAQGTVSLKKTFLESLCKTIVNQAVKDSEVVKSCSSSVYNGVMPYAKCTVVTA